VAAREFYAGLPFSHDFTVWRYIEFKMPVFSQAECFSWPESLDLRPFKLKLFERK